MSLPKAVLTDSDMVAKARAMIRAGRTNAQVSDYLGMVIQQVQSLRRTTSRTRRGRPASPYLNAAAGKQFGMSEERLRRIDAERGSQALLESIQRLQGRAL